VLNFHKWTNEDGEVLILRRIPQDRTTYNGFVWKSGVGTTVECPDWNDSPTCGNGLHGWVWGFGLGDGCDYDIIGDIWLVIGCKPEDVIAISNSAKCKFKQGIIRLEGSFQDAINTVKDGMKLCIQDSSKNKIEIEKENDKQAQSGSYSQQAQSGNYSQQAQSGNHSQQAQSGDDSQQAQSGDDSQQAQSGNYSQQAQSGNYSRQAQSGNYSQQAQSGDDSQQAQSGDDSQQAQSGDDSQQAQSGNYSRQAQSGNYSQQAQSGDDSRQESVGKDCCCAAAAKNCKIKVGERGAFALAYYTEEEGWRFLTGKVGENGIKPYVWYEIADGKIVEATE